MSVTDTGIIAKKHLPPPDEYGQVVKVVNSMLHANRERGKRFVIIMALNNASSAVQQRIVSELRDGKYGVYMHKGDVPPEIVDLVNLDIQRWETGILIDME